MRKHLPTRTQALHSNISKKFTREHGHVCALTVNMRMADMNITLEKKLRSFPILSSLVSYNLRYMNMNTVHNTSTVIPYGDTAILEIEDRMWQISRNE